jgi:hypothetical protein
MFLTGGAAATNDPDRHSATASNKAPQAKPNAKAAAILARIVHSFKIAGVPAFTMPANSNASQFVSRMHPCEVVCPIMDGSGVP